MVENSYVIRLLCILWNISNSNEKNPTEDYSLKSSLYSIFVNKFTKFPMLWNNSSIYIVKVYFTLTDNSLHYS